MRVLIFLNDGGIAGGHVIQATRTAQALGAAGVDVTLSDEVGSDDWDVIHGFGLSPPMIRLARRSGSPVVLSTIWCSAGYTTGRTRPRSLLRKLEQTMRLGASVIRRGAHETARNLRASLQSAAQAFESADLLLPNSRLEEQQIRTDLGVTTPMHVVPNAVAAEVFTPPPDGQQRQAVLCVGRIEPHKNQLALIRELRGSGHRLTIVGPEHPHHSAYVLRCRHEADETVTFLPPVDQLLLRDLYRSAAVHVLPSWFETTGLASLEAAAAGCAVVSTNRGYVREYFGELVDYCDPGVKGSIRAAVETALSKPASTALRKRILENYTWDETARRTIEAYEIVLSRDKSGTAS